MILVITEKPSVALAVSKVLGAYKREDGYYEGSVHLAVGFPDGEPEMAAPRREGRVYHVD